MFSDSLNFEGVVGAALTRLRKPKPSEFKPKGRFRVEHLDKDGNVKNVYEFNNDIVNVGKNDILGVYFHSDSQTATGRGLSV
jgi:hypothetical protein